MSDRLLGQKAPPPATPVWPPRDLSTPPPPPPGSYAQQSVQHESVPAATTTAVSKEVRQYTMFLHLSPLILALIGMAAGGMSFFGFLGPLIMWLIKKDDSAFIDRHGKEATNFNITIGLAFLALFILTIILTIITLGLAIFIMIPAFIALFIVNLVCSIKAAMAANNGQEYRYPMTIRMIN